jgi:uncharacterized membrane protein YphA (DoxX/SURF4 family)
LTIWTEIIGGLCVAMGALVPLISIPMVVLLVAIFTVHLQYGFSSIKLQAVELTGARFGQPGFETGTYCILPALLHWLSAEVDRFRSTAGLRER